MHGGIRGNGTAAPAARALLLGPVPDPGPAPPAGHASDLSGPRGCYCCRRWSLRPGCSCRSHCCCCRCCCCRRRRRPCYSCAGPLRALLQRVRGGRAPSVSGDTRGAGAADGGRRCSGCGPLLLQQRLRLDTARRASEDFRPRAGCACPARACPALACAEPVTPSPGESARLTGPPHQPRSRPFPPEPRLLHALGRLSDRARANHNGFCEGVAPCWASPPPADLGLFWRVAAACEREPPSSFQSVSVLWNVANVEAKRALASFGGPCKLGWIGRGEEAGLVDTCAAFTPSARPLGLSPGIFCPT